MFTNIITNKIIYINRNIFKNGTYCIERKLVADGSYFYNYFLIYQQILIKSDIRFFLSRLSLVSFSTSHKKLCDSCRYFSYFSSTNQFR